MESFLPPSRRKCKQVLVRNVPIGGDAPVSIQSMTNTDTRNVRATVDQIELLQETGCEIVRCAVPDEDAAKALREIKSSINIPLVADIHFNHRLALMAIESGCDKIRINPGNIGGAEKLREVVAAASDARIPIRVGVNSGSLEREILQKYGFPSGEALADSALKNVRMLEVFGFDNIVISAKASDVERTVQAYRIIAAETEYPLHLGVTEAGGEVAGAIKSALAFGLLLSEGAGDTVRVSLTADPVKEIRAATTLLRALRIRDVGLDIISCPKCGRSQVDVEKIAGEVERRLGDIRFPLKVAVMGCAVNGPGEAREADVGIAGGKEEFLLFRRGEPIGKVSEEKAVDELEKVVKEMLETEK